VQATTAMARGSSSDGCEADEVSGEGSRNGYLRVCVGRTDTRAGNEWN